MEAADRAMRVSQSLALSRRVRSSFPLPRGFVAGEDAASQEGRRYRVRLEVEVDGMGAAEGLVEELVARQVGLAPAMPTDSAPLNLDAIEDGPQAGRAARRASTAPSRGGAAPSAPWPDRAA